jgi:hypothetical protein
LTEIPDAPSALRAVRHRTRHARQRQLQAAIEVGGQAMRFILLVLA